MDKNSKETASTPVSVSVVKPYRLLHSHGYVRRVKRMVQAIRGLRGISDWARKAPQLKNDATDEQKNARNAYENNRLSVETVHFFAQPYEIGHERRDRSKTPNISDELSGKEPVNRL